jgi:hypothetical protein
MWQSAESSAFKGIVEVQGSDNAARFFSNSSFVRVLYSSRRSVSMSLGVTSLEPNLGSSGTLRKDAKTAVRTSRDIYAALRLL